MMVTSNVISLHIFVLRYQKGLTYYAYFGNFTRCTYYNVIRDLHICLIKIYFIGIHQLMNMTNCVEKHDSYFTECSSTT